MWLLQADLAAEEAAATEAALRKRSQNVDDMEASIGRREAALGEAATKVEQRESALRSNQQALEQQQAQLQATRLESKELQVCLAQPSHRTSCSSDFRPNCKTGKIVAIVNLSWDHE